MPHELRSRMAGVDWVVVPSIWWESSPMVIQEAFTCGRPLLVSDIGGMAEKVTSEVDGIKVSAGSILAWEKSLKQASEFVSEWDELQRAIKKPISYLQCAVSHSPLFLVNG